MVTEVTFHNKSLSQALVTWLYLLYKRINTVLCCVLWQSFTKTITNRSTRLQHCFTMHAPPLLLRVNKYKWQKIIITASETCKKSLHCCSLMILDHRKLQIHSVENVLSQNLFIKVTHCSFKLALAWEMNPVLSVVLSPSLPASLFSATLSRATPRSLSDYNKQEFSDWLGKASFAKTPAGSAAQWLYRCRQVLSTIRSEINDYKLINCVSNTY